jgi:hypothetical protein
MGPLPAESQQGYPSQQPQHTIYEGGFNRAEKP